jgi:CTP synthase (UTP-ammonia lyase)
MIPATSLKIGIIGDHNPSFRSHTATEEAIMHAAAAIKFALEIRWLPTPDLTTESLKSYNALWCAPGLPSNRESVFLAIRFARENGIPYMGTCGGFQHTLIEFARNALNIREAEHEETSPGASTLFITKLACSLVGTTQDVTLLPGSQAYAAYGKAKTSEQFRCNYGLNPQFRDAIAQSALKISGIDDNDEVRIVELPEHPFYMATLFLPQLSSSPANPHPLILACLKAALKNLANFTAKPLFTV